MIFKIFRDQWFLVGVVLITGFVLWNPSGFALSTTHWLESIHLNTLGIAVIFLVSGLELQWDHLIEALQDWKGTCLALASIFIFAPLLAWLLSLMPVPEGIGIGLMLIGIVPTTLASGVVMSQTAGGNTALSVVITILANLLGIVLVPLELAIWISSKGLQLEFPYLQVSFNLFILVLVPLVAGMLFHRLFAKILKRIPFALSIISRCIVLGILLIGLSRGRMSILQNVQNIFYAITLVIALHLLTATILWKILLKLQWRKERRTSIFLMGIQKTLPLSAWLQTTFFPSHGLALVICLFYHIFQLFSDNYLINRLQHTEKINRNNE